MIKIVLLNLYFILLSSLTWAQLFREGDKFTTDTIHLIANRPDYYHIVTLTVKLDSVVLNNDIEIYYYQYTFCTYMHDNNLINNHISNTYTIEIKFMLKNDSLIISRNKEDFGKMKMIALKTFRNDSINIIIDENEYSLLSSLIDTVKVRYLPNKFHYSTVDMFFKGCVDDRGFRYRYSYDKGIDLIEIYVSCMDVNSLHKVDYIPPICTEKKNER